MIRVLPMPIANYRIDGKDLFTEHQMQAYTIECQESETPQREWVGLTDEEIRNEANHHVFDESFFNGAVWARGKIKEKNRG